LYKNTSTYIKECSY